MTGIYTIVNDSDLMDAPHSVSFCYRKPAEEYVRELFRVYLEYSKTDPTEPLPEPETYYNGEKYTFEGGYCTETVFLIETELLGE